MLLLLFVVEEETATVALLALVVEETATTATGSAGGEGGGRGGASRGRGGRHGRSGRRQDEGERGEEEATVLLLLGGSRGLGADGGDDEQEADDFETHFEGFWSCWRGAG